MSCNCEEVECFSNFIDPIQSLPFSLSLLQTHESKKKEEERGIHLFIDHSTHGNSGFAENVSDPFNLRWNGIDVQTTSSIQLEIQRSPLHPASLEIMRQKLDTVLAQASLIQRWSPTARIEQSKDFYPLVRLDAGIGAFHLSIRGWAWKRAAIDYSKE